jgi:hypothetical protein
MAGGIWDGAKKGLARMQKGPGHKSVQHVPFEATFCHFPDILFYFMYWMAVAMMAWLALDLGLSNIKEEYEGYAADYDDAVQEYAKNEVEEQAKGYLGILKICGIAALLSCGLTCLWICIMMAFGGCLIYTIMACCSVFLACCGMTLHVNGMITVSYICMAGAGTVVLYMICIRNRIALASETLKISCEVILYNCVDLLVLVALMIVVQCIWCTTCFVAAIGVYLENKKNADDGEEAEYNLQYALTCLLFIFFWGIEVNKNILICTAASTTASYWFETKPTYHPTWKAFYWAVTYSLGGIAMGSAIVAVVETIFCVVEYMKRHESNKYMKKILELIQCFLVCLKKCAEYINNYAYAYIGIHGYSFCYAGYKVFGLFLSQGATVATNDFFVTMVVMLGKASVTICMIAAGIVTARDGPESWTDGIASKYKVCAILSGLIGYAISSIAFGLIESANKTVFICWLENPHAFERTHKKEHDELRDIWIRIGQTEREVDLDEKKIVK